MGAESVSNVPANIPKGSEAENRACSVHADLPVDLRNIVSAWSTLPEHIKAAIKALIGAAGS